MAAGPLGCRRPVLGLHGAARSLPSADGRQAVLRFDPGSRAVTGWRAPAFMISAMSSSLNRRCLPTNVQGIKRALALVLSHD